MHTSPIALKLVATKNLKHTDARNMNSNLAPRTNISFTNTYKI